MNKQFTPGDDEIEIDLLEVLFVLKKRIWMLILAALICGGAFFSYSRFILTPQYTSTSMLYILTKETTLASLADLQIGSQLTKDYTVIISSRPVLQEVIDTMGLNMSYKALEKKIEVSNPKDTRILRLSVTDPDPRVAKEIVDQISKTASNYIGDIMEMVPPKLIEDGEIPTEKTSPHNGKNAIIGALLGVMLVCALSVYQVVMNDSIMNEEDVEKYLDLTVLASIPDQKSEEKLEKKHKASNKKADDKKGAK